MHINSLKASTLQSLATAALWFVLLTAGYAHAQKTAPDLTLEQEPELQLDPPPESPIEVAAELQPAPEPEMDAASETQPEPQADLVKDAQPEPQIDTVAEVQPELAVEAGEAAAALVPEAADTNVVAEQEADEADQRELPKAPNVPLDEPITATPREEPTPAKEQESVRNLVLLGTEVPPRTSTRLAWAPTQSFEGIYIATPVLVVNGVEPGPTLCLTAALHGDELNGIETVRRVLYNLDPSKLKGAVIGVPIVNLQGFHASSRYLSDRRDLNRFFPGDPNGSSASRLAYSFFHEVIAHCSALVDLHTGSFFRTNLPQLRGDLNDPRVLELTKGFGSTVVVHSEGTSGTLRRSAVEAEIPAVTLEAGGPSVLDEESVNHSVKGIRTLLNHLGMTTRFSLWGDPQPVYYNSVWQRAPVGGIVFSRVALGQTVKKGDVLGTVTNPITNVRSRIVSSYNGRVIGMALNQVVQPGFATHHIGIAAPRGQVSQLAAAATTEADSTGASGAGDNGSREIEVKVDAGEAGAEGDHLAPVSELQEGDEDLAED
jgi:predicted deacylase